MKALSILQPWAWAIIAGHKSIENRNWTTRYRGPLLIHAGKGFTRSAYGDIFRHASRDKFDVPPIESFMLGGFIGTAELVDVVTTTRDPWFNGPFGWVLAKPKSMKFTPYPGQLRLFEVPDDFGMP